MHPNHCKGCACCIAPCLNRRRRLRAALPAPVFDPDGALSRVCPACFSIGNTGEQELGVTRSHSAYWAARRQRMKASPGGSTARPCVSPTGVLSTLSQSSQTEKAQGCKQLVASYMKHVRSRSGRVLDVLTLSTPTWAKVSQYSGVPQREMVDLYYFQFCRQV